MDYVISHTMQALKKHVPIRNVDGITELLLKLVIDGKSDYEQSRLNDIADRDYT